MVYTRSQHIGDDLNPENIIPLIQTTINDDLNPAGGLANDQRTDGTQVLRGTGHSRDRTYTTTPIDYNYPSKEVSSETDMELARLRL